VVCHELLEELVVVTGAFVVCQRSGKTETSGSCYSLWFANHSLWFARPWEVCEAVASRSRDADEEKHVGKGTSTGNLWASVTAINDGRLLMAVMAGICSEHVSEKREQGMEGIHRGTCASRPCPATSAMHASQIPISTQFTQAQVAGASMRMDAPPRVAMHTARVPSAPPCR
jgi:hypothetical protein